MPELQPADPAVLAIRVAHLVDEVHGIAAVGIHRLFQAHRLYHRFQCRGHLPAGQACLPGDLVHSGFPAQLLLQRFAGLHGPVGGIAQAAAYPQGIVIPQKAPDLADDHGHAVGGKPHRLGRVKVVDGFDEPDAPHLKQVVEVFAPLGKALHHAQHQPQVALHHAFPCSCIPGVGLQEQLPLFAFGQNRKLRRVHAAQFHLIVHPNAPGLF